MPVGRRTLVPGLVIATAVASVATMAAVVVGSGSPPAQRLDVVPVAVVEPDAAAPAAAAGEATLPAVPVPGAPATAVPSVTVTPPAVLPSVLPTVTAPPVTATPEVTPEATATPSPTAPPPAEPPVLVPDGPAARLAVATAGGAPTTATFAGTAGQKVIWEFTGLAPDGAAADVTTRVLRPDGSTLWSDTDNGWSDVQTLPVTGTYSVTVAPWSTTWTGGIDVRLSTPQEVRADPLVLDGPAVTMASTVRGQVVSSSFSGTAGDRVVWQFFDLDPNQSLDDVVTRVYRPDHTLLWSDTDEGWSDAQTLSATGTYVVTVDPVGDNVRSIRARLVAAPADAVAGPATVGGPPLHLTTTERGQLARTSFTGRAGQRVVWEFRDLSPDLNGNDIATRVYRPDGSVLWTDADNGWSDVQTLTADGTYTVVADPVGEYVRDITFEVIAQPGDAFAGRVNLNGRPVTLANALRGQNASATFSGTEGQRVIWELSDLAPDGGGVDVTTRVHRPDGTVIWSDADNGWSDVQTLPATGTYTVTMDPVGDHRRSIHFQISSQPGDLVVDTLAVGDPAVTLENLQRGQVMRTSFAGTQGQRVTWELLGLTPNGTGADVATRVYRPDGTVLWSDTDDGWSDVQTLPATGTYQVLVDPIGDLLRTIRFVVSAPPADVVVPVQELGAPPVELSTTERGQLVRTSFAGTAGTRVVIAMTGTTPNATGTDASVRVYRPDGTLWWSGSDNSTSDPLTLPATGSYTVVVDPVGDYVRRFSFSVR